MLSVTQRILRTGLLLPLAISTFGQQPTSSQTSRDDIPVIASDSLPIVPGDQITVKVFDVAELDQAHLRVTDAGDIPLLLLGSVKITGLTPAAASKLIAAAYMDHRFLRDAHVAVIVESYSSSDVTVFGYAIGAQSSSTTNGLTVPLATPKPLLTVLSLAGGLSDRASRTVTVQRRDRSIKPFRVLLPNNPAPGQVDETMIYPGDTIIVPRAGFVYVLGDVAHSSSVLMSEDGSISLMQALSQVGSPLPSASYSSVAIFRKVDGEYRNIPANFGKIIKGKEPDVQLKAEDVIWVPFSFGKNLLVNGASIAAAVSSATATGIIYSH
jgi:polysaccharide biosynthesis/export protein